MKGRKRFLTLPDRKISLKGLVNRIKIDETMLEKYSDDEEFTKMIRNNMEKQRSYIVQCVLENEDNELLDQIYLKM